MNRKQRGKQQRLLAKKKRRIRGIALFIVAGISGSVAAGVYFSGKEEEKKPVKVAMKQEKKSADSRENPPKKELAKTGKEASHAIDTSKWIAPTSETAWVPTLMYHSITNEIKDNNCLSPENLESQLKALKEDGYVALSPKEAFLVFKENKKPAEKVVWLTFDDGYENFYEEVYPLLKKYGMKATSFVVTDFLNAEGYLEESQILEMQKSGLVSFESHTVSHLSLESLDAAAQKERLLQSKKKLDDLLKQKTSVICYPSGKFNEETEKIAKECGYQLGVTTQPGFAEKSDGWFTLPRVRISSSVAGSGLLLTLKQAEGH